MADSLELSVRIELSFASPWSNGSFAVSFQTGAGFAWCQGDARPTDGRADEYVLDLTEVILLIPSVNSPLAPPPQPSTTVSAPVVQ